MIEKWFSSVFLCGLSSEFDAILFIKPCRLQRQLTSWITLVDSVACFSKGGTFAGNPTAFPKDQSQCMESLLYPNSISMSTVQNGVAR